MNTRTHSPKNKTSSIRAASLYVVAHDMLTHSAVTAPLGVAFGGRATDEAVAVAVAVAVGRPSMRASAAMCEPDA